MIKAIISIPNYVLDIDIKGDAILFKEVKHKGSTEFVFTGVPFVILVMKWLDCTYGVGRSMHLNKEKKD